MSFSIYTFAEDKIFTNMQVELLPKFLYTKHFMQIKKLISYIIL